METAHRTHRKLSEHMTKDAHALWREYVERERALIEPRLAALGYTLELEQPHLEGERFLMQAVTTTSGKKIILLGMHAHHGRVVIKYTSDTAGMREIEHERTCRNALHAIPFAYSVFEAPLEIHFEKKDASVLYIQKYIDQEKSFIDRPLKEQFSLALSSLKAQEGVHATTYAHHLFSRSIFGSLTSDDYLSLAQEHAREITFHVPHHNALVQKVLLKLRNEQKYIEQYCGFLTHNDFVPHNIRIVATTVYLLDASSLRFGNKHEGWARFLNFMTLYNPGLEQALETYVQQNRAPEEVASLHLMRLYRLLELVRYYGKVSSLSTGPLKTLNEARITFWATILQLQLEQKPVPTTLIVEYQTLRDSLRSADEHKRQQGLH